MESPSQISAWNLASGAGNRLSSSQSVDLRISILGSGRCRCVADTG